jgi:Tol biopolymer transport system component
LINFQWGIDECPAIAPDGSYLVFNSFRGVWNGGGFGHNDLWVSFRESDDRWTNPRNLGPEFNTGQADIYPSISPDGRFLFFTHRQKSYGRTFTGTPTADGGYTITILAQDEQRATCPAVLNLFVTSR